MRKGRVEGKAIVITGAAQGIGFTCARMLAEEGASVVLSDIQEAQGVAAAARITDAGGQATFVRADVSSEADCANLVAQAVRIYGRLDGLMNNAGWYPRGYLEETTTEVWDKIQDVNLRGPF